MMKHTLFPLALLLLSTSAPADNFDTALDKFRASSGTKSFFAEAYGYALFPTIGKGGIGIGGTYGKGRVYRNNAVTGLTEMVQISIGFQFGGQAYSQIIFFKNKTAYNRFTSGSFEFGAEASAVAITLGASAQTGTTGTSQVATRQEPGTHHLRGTGRPTWQYSPWPRAVSCMKRQSPGKNSAMPLRMMRADTCQTKANHHCANPLLHIPQQRKQQHIAN
jgi:hypothetical protein